MTLTPDEGPLADEAAPPDGTLSDADAAGRLEAEHDAQPELSPTELADPDTPDAQPSLQEEELRPSDEPPAE